MRDVLLAGVVAAALAMPVSAHAVTYTAAGFAIPDNSAAGASSTINVTHGGVVQGMDLSLFGLTHTWVGDLSGSLTHAGITVEWMTQSNPGNGRNLNGDYIIRDGAAEALNAATGSPITPGVYASENPFAAFNGTSWEGDWTLTMADSALLDVGALSSWGLNLDPMGVGGGIPDNTPGGFTSTITLDLDGRVDELGLTLFNATHTWLGDLRGTLSHGGVTVNWLQPSVGNGVNLAGDYTFRDDAVFTLDTASGSPRPPGVYRPDDLLDAFHGLEASGDWVLTIADVAFLDTGRFDGWNLAVTTYVPEPETWTLMILGLGAAGAVLRRRSLAAS